MGSQCSFGHLKHKLWPEERPGVKARSHLDVAHVERCWVYVRGEGGDFLQVWAVVSLVSPSYPWLVLAPKVFQLCNNHLVLVLCRFVWVVEACQFFLVPSWNSNIPLYPSRVLRAKECAPTLYYFDVSSLYSHLNPSRSLGARRCVLSITSIDVCSASYVHILLLHVTNVQFN
jgi:hypothetical protein